MNTRLDQRIREILQAKHRRRIWARIVAVLASFVVLFTSLEMSSPADAVTVDKSPVIDEPFIMGFSENVIEQDGSESELLEEQSRVEEVYAENTVENIEEATEESIEENTEEIIIESIEESTEESTEKITEGNIEQISEVIVYSDSAAELSGWISGVYLEQSRPLESNDAGDVLSWSEWENKAAYGWNDAIQAYPVYDISADSRLRFVLRVLINPNELTAAESYDEGNGYWELETYNKLTYTLPDLLSGAIPESAGIYASVDEAALASAESVNPEERLIGYLDTDEQGTFPDGQIRITLTDDSVISNILNHEYVAFEITFGVNAWDIITHGEEKEIVFRNETQISDDTSLTDAEAAVLPAVGLMLRCAALPVETDNGAEEENSPEDNNAGVTDQDQTSVPLFNLTGGRSALLSDILTETCAFSAAVSDAVNAEEVRAFVENSIENVTFSDPQFIVTSLVMTEEGSDWVIENIVPFDGTGILTVEYRGEEDTLQSFDIEIGITGRQSAELAIATITPADGSYLPEEITGSAFVEEGSEVDAAIAAAEAFSGAAMSADEFMAPPAQVPMMKAKALRQASIPADAAFDQTSHQIVDRGGRTEHRVFNISLDMSEEEQAAYEEGFHVTVSLPECISGRDFRLYHLHENSEIQEITDLTLDSVLTDPQTGEQLLYGFSFVTDNFSQFVLSYTVDFHWNVDGAEFEYSIPGGGFVSFRSLVEAFGIAADAVNTENDEIREFLDNIESIDFSDPDLVSVSRVEQNTTVGGVKDALGLSCVYSADLIDEQIAEINAQEVSAGDWALIALKPFAGEESLTVTMKNGEQFAIRVTDAAVPSLAQIDEEKGYILYVEKNGTLYVLKTDGTTETANYSDLDTMDNNYKWKFDYVYNDGNVPYYIVRPVDDNTKSLAVDWDSTNFWDNPNSHPLVQTGGINVTLVPSGNGYKFEGYNNAKLVINDGWFAARRGDNFDPVVIYEPGQLDQFGFTVTSDDYSMGKVCGQDKNGQYKEDAEYDAQTNNNKYNQYEIKAEPQTARYIFDYWDLNGERIENGATIPAGTLSIPYQGSKLTAHFKKDPNYQAIDEEKEGRVIDKESFQAWLNELRNRNVPLDQEKCTKTAELYDYENRIYRVDLTAQSNLSMFDGDIDLGFIIDVSGSMQFPSKLEPISGYESVDILHLNDNEYTQNLIDKNKTYFFVVDRTNTANVIRLKWGYWWDGSGIGAKQHWGWGIAGYGYASDDVVEASTRYYTSAGHNLFGGDNGPFQLYTAGDNGKRRREYLESSISGTITELNNILSDLAYAQNADEAADVKIAYNTFANDVDYNHTNHSFVSVTDEGLSIGYDYKGGTDTEEALIDAHSFDWSDSATKVAVLITDGAPQQSGVDGPTLDQKVKAAANTLKGGGVKLVTVGLSMGDVKRGSRLLYDIATKDSDGDPYFYKADTGDELQYVLYEVIQQVMADAIVVGNVTDTVNEAFYPVDKRSGVPLEAGDVIDLEGNKIADSEDDLTDAQKADGHGIIGTEGENYTVTWTGQNFTWDGWHGTVYEKAKEDFLGGNAVRTNDPENPARIESEGYKIHPEDPTITFKPEIQAQGTKSLETPRVNVNELDLTDSATEWTVYLGTEVDPKSQLEAFYDRILVKEVVTAAGDVNQDGFPDRMTGTGLYYSLLESVSDGRESSGSGEQVTFRMKDLLKSLNGGTDITIDDLIAAGDTGITLPYDLYGQDCPSSIIIRLTKTGETADYNSHSTTVTGDAVETYQLLVDFKPDYEHVPTGQGGDGSKPYHTGEYGLAYQGHAAGEDYSTNTHVINVYEVPLDIYKTDENDEPLAGAAFTLYRRDDANGEAVTGISDEHKYVEVASGISGDDGIARLENGGKPFGLVQGETYYLVESAAPENYVKLDTVWTVEVQTQIGRFSDLNGEEIYSHTYPVADNKGGVSADMYPFSWDQGARIMLNGSEPVAVRARGETPGSTETITDDAFVSHKKAISFRHTVKNLGGEIDIHVHKTWNTQEQTPGSVTVTLYRVSEKDHKWGKGRIVPCTCTENGVEEYTCSACGKTETRVISAAGHTPGAAHRENEAAPTCTEAGGYDTVVRCEVCNAIISSEHTGIPAGHTWGEPQEEEASAAGYCYDTVVRCLVCGEEKENTREHHDHVWGDYVETTPAQINVHGEETCYCEHNLLHTKTRPTDPLPATVTIYFRCTGNGVGRTEYPGQITAIAQRSGSGLGDMTIQWDWNQWTEEQPFNVDGLAGGSTYSTYSTADGQEYSRRYENGRWVERGKRQTLVVSNITQNLTLYVTIRNGGYLGTNYGLVYEPTFAGISAASTAASARTLMRSAAVRLQNANMSAAGTMADAHTTRSTGLLAGTSGASSDATAALQAYLDSLKSKDEVTCAGEEGAARTYKEEVGTYTISADDGWDLDIYKLPRYNEYGKEYKYYLVETPVTGYDTAYTGQESGLQDDSTSLEIINTPKTTELTVTKEWAFAAPSNVAKVEGKEWPQGVMVHVVVYSRTGENEPAPTAYTANLTADHQTHTFTGLPEYAGNDRLEYSVVEAGVTGLDSTNFNTVIEGDAESGYIIRNTEKEAGLTIVKSFAGDSLTDEEKNSITFTVTGSGLRDRSTGSSVQSLTKTYAEFDEGRWVLNQIDGIVSGGTYTVTETNNNFESYVRETTIKADEGTPSVFAQGDGSTDPSASITLEGTNGTVTVTNTYLRLVDLDIVKVDANGMTTPLKGAKFELRKVVPDNPILNYYSADATLPTTSGEEHKTGADGKAAFEGLTAGYYEVREAEMPPGYVRTGTGVFYIRVANGEITHVERTVTEDDDGVSHVIWLPGSDDAKFEFTAANGNNPATAKVGNEPGATLPNTGGSGTAKIYLLGILLIALAAAGIAISRGVEKQVL